MCFIEAETRDGIEGLVSLGKDDMPKFAVDEEMIHIRSTTIRGTRFSRL